MRRIILPGLALVFLLGALGCSRTEPEQKPSVQQRMDVQKEKKQKAYMQE